ncbi:Protein SDS23 [Ceratocystis fimbriata CBS 114723]|uniref:Protein SDS23 n=1 Tax=Ceratocystis fimbriata CBS 114723 TaxID=1035309 RepID=A0A2C5XJH5_9PEZI|nr:Protein SDS23 [Ceratocystis fimbriata CBS 114723]
MDNSSISEKGPNPGHSSDSTETTAASIPPSASAIPQKIPSRETSAASLRINSGAAASPGALASAVGPPPAVNIPVLATHRQALAENLYSIPSSPRSARHPSFTQAALQDLVSIQSHAIQRNRKLDPRFADRDWREVAIGELAVADEVKWVTMDTSVQEATNALLKTSPTNAVLIRETETSESAISTFDYNDLNAYLLVIVGIAKPDDETRSMYAEIATKAHKGQALTLADIQPVCRKESLVALPRGEKLDKAIEVLGSGIHRLLVTDDNGHVVGILDQLKIVAFFWKEGINFPAIDSMYSASIQDLGIASKSVLAVSQDSPLTEALLLMFNEGLTSVAIVDSMQKVVGNISTVDVRHLTTSSSAHLLQNTCLNFISVILNARGVDQGRDSFPVFYTTNYSTLSHTLAKLVATQSHRMWVVETASPANSNPATPLLPQKTPVAASSSPVLVPTGSATHYSSSPSHVSFLMSAAGSHGHAMSGRLAGVVSLTDILNLFAKTTGMNPADPNEQRAKRRRSSSSSVRPSLDSVRTSLDIRR